MNDDQIKAAVAACPKGANVYMQWERPVKLRVAYKGMPLVKRTKMLLRLLSYDNMKAVQDKRESGELPAENAGLKGKEWVEFPFLKRSLKTGKLLLSVKLAVVYGKSVVKSETTFLLDGQEVKKAEYIHAMLASEYAKREIPETFDVTAEGVNKVHEYEIAPATVEEVVIGTSTASNVTLT